MLVVTSLSGYLSVNLATGPINAGRYYLGVFNSNAIPQAIRLDAIVDLDPGGSIPVAYTSAGMAPILDDAVSVSTIHVTNASPILSIDVGVRIDHPRVSDLVLTLVSPSGTRVLLDENRGGTSSNGMGLNVILTNISVASSSYGAAASTNIIPAPATSGNLVIDYDFWSEADTLHVYLGTNLSPANLIFDSGAVSNTGTFYVAFATNDSRLISIVIDEARPLTTWNYTATLTGPALLYTTFTDNTNLTVTPIKFAPSPFTNVTLDPLTLTPSGGMYYLPEQSLHKLAGESALGDWTLELLDNRAGATNPQPSLVSWQLLFLFQNHSYATNVVITSCQALSNNFCLTWTSVSNLHYYVQGQAGVTGTNWVAVSPTIVAADVLTSCCLPLPSPYHAFRVCVGSVPYAPPVQITSLARDANGVRLQWLAPTNCQFQAQWTASLAPAAWIPFTNILTSTSGVFSFLDDGSQSGGLAGQRCYRLKQLP